MAPGPWYGRTSPQNPSIAGIKGYNRAEGAADETPSLTKTSGPVIRVAPNELSIYDIDAYLSEIYAQNTKFTKAPYFYEAFDHPHGTVFSKLDKAAHSAEKRPHVTCLLAQEHRRHAARAVRARPQVG